MGLQAVQQAETLLKAMDFVGLPHVLASFGQSEAVLLILMRFVEAAAALGDAFFRYFAWDPHRISNLVCSAFISESMYVYVVIISCSKGIISC